MFFLKMPHHHQPTIIHHQWIHTLICFYFHVDTLFESSSYLNIQHGSSHAALCTFYIFRTKNRMKEKELSSLQLTTFCIFIIICRFDSFLFFNMPFERLFVHKPLRTLFIFFLFSLFRVPGNEKCEWEKKKWKKWKYSGLSSLNQVDGSSQFSVFWILIYWTSNTERWALVSICFLLPPRSTLHALYFFSFFFFSQGICLYCYRWTVNGKRKKLFRCIIIIVFYHQYWQFSNANCEYSSAHKP